MIVTRGLGGVGSIVTRGLGDGGVAPTFSYVETVVPIWRVAMTLAHQVEFEIPTDVPEVQVEGDDYALAIRDQDYLRLVEVLSEEHPLYPPTLEIELSGTDDIEIQVTHNSQNPPDVIYNVYKNNNIRLFNSSSPGASLLGSTTPPYVGAQSFIDTSSGRGDEANNTAYFAEAVYENEISAPSNIVMEHDITFHYNTVYRYVPIMVTKAGVTGTVGEFFNFVIAQHPDVDRIIYRDDNGNSFVVTYVGDPDGNYPLTPMMNLQIRAYGLPAYPATPTCVIGTYDPYQTLAVPRLDLSYLGIHIDNHWGITNTDELTAYLESLGWFGFYYRVFGRNGRDAYKRDERNNPVDYAIMYSSDSEALYGFPTDLVTLEPLDSIGLQWSPDLAPGPNYGLPTTHDPILWRRY